MKEATKRLISNETLQKRLEKAVKRYAVKKSSETSPERASRHEKHDVESPESQNHRRAPARYNKTKKLPQTRLTINKTNG
jgi:hypothetical protein